MPNDLQTAEQANVRVESNGRAIVVLPSRLRSDSTSAWWQSLESCLRDPKITSVEVDASPLESCDSSAIAMLQYLQTGGLTPGVFVTIRGLRPDLQRRSQNFAVADFEQHQAQPQPKPHMAEEAGAAFHCVINDLREQIVFLGTASAAIASTLFDRKRMRWHEVKRVFELAGANALPIVSLISLLVGLIIAFESAQPLAQFGAQIYIANLIGLVMVRELGPLMTAIMVAGRSGSAFAAEIGTMKVNEELNALETMGLDPIRFLVVQRLIAAMLLMPLLTVYSMLMGVGGGVIVMLCLHFPFTLIRTQLMSSIGAIDISLGVSKALVFGAIVAGIGCLRGLQTRKGPSAVGESTTRAVVSSILLIIIADAVFALITFVLEI